MITEELQKLYQSYTGVPAENITELPSSGSNRRYFRLTGIETLIGVYGASIDENEAFLYMAGHFRKCGLPVPEVRIASEDKTYYLQEDLGDTLLFHAIEKGRATSVFSEEEKELLRKTIRLLPAIQFAGADGFDFSRCYPQPEFNQRSILWDLNYFKYCFLKATGMEFQEDKLEDDFQKMSDVLLRSSSATFMYRDFQSRNVMIKDGTTTENDRHNEYVEDDEICQTVTKSLTETILTVTTNLGTTDNPRNISYKLLLVFNGDECVVSGLDGVTATGTGKFVQDGEKNSWGNKDRDAIYLKYTVDFSNGLKLETEDTLVAHSRGVAREDFTPIYVKN